MCYLAHFFCILTNNNYMEIFFIALLVLVVIITINIHLNLHVSYDLYKNIGKITVKMFGITFYRADISLISGYFNLIWNKKVVQIKIDLNDENFKFIGDIADYAIKKTYFTNINTDLKVYGTNPCQIAILSGNLIILEGILRSMISYRSPGTLLTNKFDIGYIDNYIKIQMGCGVLITIFDFIWAVLRASIRRGIYVKRA